jgi:hypothetical protein
VNVSERVIQPAGTCPVCGLPRQAEFVIVTSGGMVVRRQMVRRWCPSHCTHDQIVAAEQEQSG